MPAEPISVPRQIARSPRIRCPRLRRSRLPLLRHDWPPLARTTRSRHCFETRSQRTLSKSCWRIDSIQKCWRMRAASRCVCVLHSHPLISSYEVDKSLWRTGSVAGCDETD